MYLDFFFLLLLLTQELVRSTLEQAIIFISALIAVVTI